MKDIKLIILIVALSYFGMWFLNDGNLPHESVLGLLLGTTVVFVAMLRLIRELTKERHESPQR